MNNYDNTNIFAKIMRGEMPCHKVYEDENTFAFLDIMPRGDGHCLVLPKRPARNILDADDKMLAQVYSTVRKVSIAAIKALGADGLTIQQFNEPAGGQIVFHMHVHVIPRFDGVKLQPPVSNMEDVEVLADHAAKLRGALEAR